MSELRWILLSLGILLIAGLYLSARTPFPKLKSRIRKPAPRDAESAVEPVESGGPMESGGPTEEKPRQQRRRSSEKIVTLRVVCRHQNDMKADDAVLALKRRGLVHGKYGIFHRTSDNGGEEPVFSVASLTEPGSFDLNQLKGSAIAGLSLFLVLPGPGDPVARFDAMIELARDLAEDLDGILLDERGSSWSIQRERYIREEIIQFHHQLSHG